MNPEIQALRLTVLVRKANRKLLRDVKVIAGEECAPQHKLVINIKSMIERKRPFVPRRKIWKLKDSEISDSFYTHFTQNLDKIDEADRNGNVESKWATLKDCLLEASDSVCGWTKGPVRRRETWWWNRDVDNAVKEKRRLWKEWKQGGSKEPYLAAKRKAKSLQ